MARTSGVLKADMAQAKQMRKENVAAVAKAVNLSKRLTGEIFRLLNSETGARRPLVFPNLGIA